MKRLFLSMLILASLQSHGEWKQGFDKREMMDMIAICNSFTFLDLYHTDSAILPAAYKKVYTSGVFGMDNKFQIYENESLAVINLRGSTDKQISWLENIYSAMIPAIGKIEVEGETFQYFFAKDKKAAVHSGFALGLAYLHTELLAKINDLNRRGIYDILLTGHSQGGALVNLFRAFLAHLPEEELSKKNRFKVYTFGAPMIGNKEFAEEFNALFCDPQSAFNIINRDDRVPTLPMGYNDTNLVYQNLSHLLFERESFSFRKLVSDGGANLFESKLERAVKVISGRASRRIAGDLGQAVMPKYTSDINYQRLGNVIEIDRFVYPKILKDSTILQNDSLMALYKRNKDGSFVNERLYVREPRTYQHKPYNYYSALMQLYFPKQYAVLDKKYLPENL